VLPMRIVASNFLGFAIKNAAVFAVSESPSDISSP